MSKIVYKYSLVPRAAPWKSLIVLPKGAKILKLDFQLGIPHLWCEVAPDTDKETRTFFLVPTGQELPKGAIWRDSVLHGDYVWHLYEVSA